MPTLIAIALCALFAVADALAAPDTTRLSAKEPATSESPTTITLRGDIDQAMLESFRRQLRTTTSTVRITSAGGLSAPALLIAEDIARLQLTVVVSGLCASSCAQLIFVAGKRRVVEPGSIILFHNSIASMVLLGEKIGHSAPAGWIHQFRALQGREAELYRRRGVSAQALLDPEYAMMPRCIAFRRTFDGRLEWTVIRLYRGWVPTRAYMEAVGIQFTGPWPKSRQEVETLLVPFSPTNGRYVRFGDEDHLKSSSLSIRFGIATFGVCSNDTH
jgi:hypothetical protein